MYFIPKMQLEIIVNKKQWILETNEKYLITIHGLQKQKMKLMKENHYELTGTKFN